MRAETPGAFGIAVRWGHAPLWVVIVSLVGFVRLYLRAGRLWLAREVCGLRTLSLILNFVCTPNLNYREITALRHILFLGESVSVAEGVPNRRMPIGRLSVMLLIIFIADAQSPSGSGVTAGRRCRWVAPCFSFSWRGQGRGS